MSPVPAGLGADGQTYPLPRAWGRLAPKGTEGRRSEWAWRPQASRPPIFCNHFVLAQWGHCGPPSSRVASSSSESQPWKPDRPPKLVARSLRVCPARLRWPGVPRSETPWLREGHTVPARRPPGCGKTRWASAPSCAHRVLVGSGLCFIAGSWGVAGGVAQPGASPRGHWPPPGEACQSLRGARGGHFTEGSRCSCPWCWLWPGDRLARPPRGRRRPLTRTLPEASPRLRRVGACQAASRLGRVL